jgi:hypothetical protein
MSKLNKKDIEQNIEKAYKSHDFETLKKTVMT